MVESAFWEVSDQQNQVEELVLKKLQIKVENEENLGQKIASASAKKKIRKKRSAANKLANQSKEGGEKEEEVISIESTQNLSKISQKSVKNEKDIVEKEEKREVKKESISADAHEMRMIGIGSFRHGQTSPPSIPLDKLRIQ
eukprot:TRINITY_DN2835_c0_g1_i1.p1 TRINITY_DN2835_c0_g1~~TRINITY_DN2835_c0_g1_i1.p1  ORF type:complete len:153 (-),score=74.24 TRINITY_DN2835_c0_g1_i1:120-545(-)